MTPAGVSVPGQTGVLPEPAPVDPEALASIERRVLWLADYIDVQSGLDEVKLLGPPREHPGPLLARPRRRLLELLAALPDDAGVQAVWRALAL